MRHETNLYLFVAIALVGAVASGQAIAQTEKDSDYRSPYSVKFSVPIRDLIDDLNQGLRADPHEQSSVPFADWYSSKVRKKYGAWGPPARAYPPPTAIESRTAQWKRERVIAAGLRFQGLGYQHHHVPDWDPPSDWPWKERTSGRNGKGVDCSNFTAFAYNLGLGVKFTSDVQDQAGLTRIEGQPVIHPQKIEKPEKYDDLIKTLRTSDLLFIRNNKGEISHVVLWVGSIGQSTNNIPLILDSHGEGVKDSNGVSIPHGVQLRPFREKSWYFQSGSHALRIIRGD